MEILQPLTMPGTSRTDGAAITSLLYTMSFPTPFLLESLSLDDLTLLRIHILFEEQSIMLDIEDDDNTPFSLAFQKVHAFFTNTPSITTFPRATIVAFQWQQLPQNQFRAELFLDIQFSSSVLIFTIIFEKLYRQDGNTFPFPTLLL